MGYDGFLYGYGYPRHMCWRAGGWLANTNGVVLRRGKEWGSARVGVRTREMLWRMV